MRAGSGAEGVIGTALVRTDQSRPGKAPART